MGLMDDPFAYHLVKDGTVWVSRGGRVVVIVGGIRAERLRTDLQQANSYEFRLNPKNYGIQSEQSE